MRFGKVLILGILFCNFTDTVQLSALIDPQEFSNQILFLGASNSVEEINSVNRDGSYVTELRSYGTPWNDTEIVDASVSGIGVSDYFGNVSRVLQNVYEHDPNYIVIILGGNDFLSRLSSSKFEERLNWLVDAILFFDAQQKIKQIFLANIYWGLIELDENRISVFEEYQQIIEDIAENNNFPLLDYFGITENHEEYYVDSIHLNADGHRVLATEVDLVVSPYLSGLTERTESFVIPTEIFSYDYLDEEVAFPILPAVLLLLFLPLFKNLKTRKDEW